MVAPTSNLVKLFKSLANLHQKQATGKFTLTAGKKQWQFYLFQGKLAYALSPSHRIRRWKRALKQQNCQLEIGVSSHSHREPWEYYRLLKGIHEQGLSLTKARSIIQSVFREVLFSISDEEEMKGHWQNSWAMASLTNGELTLPTTAIKPLFMEVQKLQNHWQGLGLKLLLLDRAPRLEINETQLNNSNASILNLKPLWNGQRTVWDLARLMKQSLEAMGRLFHYYIKQGLVKFNSLTDLSAPVTPKAQTQEQKLTARPLVVCVDDSPQMCYKIEKLLTEAGYRCLCINDSVKALPLLLKYQPDLILLDLVMPVMNGYELCAHLRKVPTFKDTPVALMTASKGIVDRVRAKMVGANALLLKPIQIKNLQALLKENTPSQPPVKVATPAAIPTAVAFSNLQVSFNPA